MGRHVGCYITIPSTWNKEMINKWHFFFINIRASASCKCLGIIETKDKAIIDLQHLQCWRICEIWKKRWKEKHPKRWCNVCCCHKSYEIIWKWPSFCNTLFLFTSPTTITTFTHSKEKFGIAFCLLLFVFYCI